MVTWDMEKMQKQAATVAVPGGLVVAVVGSRGIAECYALRQRLRELAPAQVVSGGAGGVDTLAARWAWGDGVPVRVLRPDYSAHGPAAPLVRNGLIVAAADVVLVVWDGKSRGTLSAARAAARLGRRCEWLAMPAPGAGPVPGGLPLGGFL